MPRGPQHYSRAHTCSCRICGCQFQAPTKSKTICDKEICRNRDARLQRMINATRMADKQIYDLRRDVRKLKEAVDRYSEEALADSPQSRDVIALTLNGAIASIDDLARQVRDARYHIACLKGKSEPR